MGAELVIIQEKERAEEFAWRRTGIADFRFSIAEVNSISANPVLTSAICNLKSAIRLAPGDAISRLVRLQRSLPLPGLSFPRRSFR